MENCPKIQALALHLRVNPEEISVSNYDPNLYQINNRLEKQGYPPEHFVELANDLRESLVAAIGPPAENWTSEFLRRNELENPTGSISYKKIWELLPKDPNHRLVNTLYMVMSPHYKDSDLYANSLRKAFDGQELVDDRREAWVNDGEYLVLTDTEATAVAVGAIHDSVWTFKPSFFKKFLIVDLPEDVISALQEKCEGSNDTFLKLLDSRFDEFATAAIKADGRGHFLSPYDGKERRVGEFFVYRVG